MEIPQPFHWEVWFILVKINLLLVNILLNLNWNLLYTEMQLLEMGIAFHLFRQSWDWEQFWETSGFMVSCWNDRLRHRLTHILFLWQMELNLALLLLRTLITKLIFRWKLVFPFWWIDYNKILLTFFWWSFPVSPIIKQVFWLSQKRCIYIVQYYKCILFCLRWEMSKFKPQKQVLSIFLVNVAANLSILYLPKCFPF